MSPSNPTTVANTAEKPTPAALILVAWLVVGLPLAWGVSQTWKNASKLFSAPPPPAATQPATPAVPNK